MVGHDHGWCALLLLCHIRSSVRPAMSTLLWGSGAVYHGPDPATYLASSSIVLPSPGRCYPRKLSVVSSARRLHDYTLALDARLYITAPSTNPALVSNHLARRRVPRPRCVYRCFITKKKKKTRETAAVTNGAWNKNADEYFDLPAQMPAHRDKSPSPNR